LKLVIGAGGTGGHIIPALAIAMELKSHAWEIYFIGNRNSMEESLAGKHDLPFFSIYVQKLYRSITLQHMKFPYHFLRSLVKCINYIISIKPDAVLCTGGYVSGPVAFACIILRKKFYVQDGNSYPGLTTRMVSIFAKHVFTASNEAKKYLPKANCIMTGNPLLKYNKIDKTQVNWSGMNLEKDTKKLLILGGSQGSGQINKVIDKSINRFLTMGLEVIWQTGKNHYQAISDKYKDIKGIFSFDFTDKMSEFYQMADVAVSRAGALSIAELSEHCVPTIYIPLPTSAGEHQLKNALSQVDKNIGLMIEQEYLTSDTLLEKLNYLLKNLDIYENNVLKQPKNNATQIISEIIINETQMQQENKC